MQNEADAASHWLGKPQRPRQGQRRAGWGQVKEQGSVPDMNVNYFILILIVIRWVPHETHFMDGEAEAQAICRASWEGGGGAGCC